MPLMSFADKLDKAFVLSMRLVYEGHRYRDLPLDDAAEEFDLVYGYADGLSAARHERIQTGQCSINQMISYDIEAEEVNLDADIARLEALLIKFNSASVRTSAPECAAA